MWTRAVMTLIAACAIAHMAIAQVDQREWCVDTEASALYKESVDAYMRTLSPTSSADTTALRAALWDLHSVYRRDSTCILALWTASLIYQELSEPDSAVAVLSLGLEDAPLFAESIGHIEAAQDRYQEAHEAFAYALGAMEEHYDYALTSLPEYEKADFFAAWIRLQWLTHGPSVALRAYHDLDPELQDSGPIQYYKCIIDTIEPLAYSIAIANFGDGLPRVSKFERLDNNDEGDMEVYHETDSCISFLLENQ